MTPEFWLGLVIGAVMWHLVGESFLLQVEHWISDRR